MTVMLPYFTMFLPWFSWALPWFQRVMPILNSRCREFDPKTKKNAPGQMGGVRQEGSVPLYIINLTQPTIGKEWGVSWQNMLPYPDQLYIQECVECHHDLLHIRYRLLMQGRGLEMAVQCIDEDQITILLRNRLQIQWASWSRNLKQVKQAK